MKAPTQFRPRLRAGLGLAVLVTAMYSASIALAPAADAKSDKSTAQKTEKKSEKKPLTGAELYAIHCGRCHPERYATEFKAVQWKTIVFEMRVRANLPANQAKAILKYLQEDSGK
jgi:mono/diheme cytochrome c family protein